MSKRIFDRGASMFGLLLLSPLFLVISVLIKLKMPGGPVLFSQKRVGRHGSLFTIYKFRTMLVNHGGSSVSVKGESRITPLGSFLRKYKLDELPELWNVLRGDMSFVGPRPDVHGYADRLRGQEREILSIKPGITGVASLKFAEEEELLAVQLDPKKYNDEVIYPEKVRLNLKYIENQSFWLDINIIVSTLLRREINETWVNSMRYINSYSFIIKPLFDILFSLIFLILLLPLFFAITMILLITTKGTPFFLQPRPGKNNRIFKLIKFKTMNSIDEIKGNLLPDIERITTLGRLLRSTSFDELPQLINVLKSDMSLIGPRPLHVEYLPLYSDEQAKRHIVKPGITGWAQINGRNSITWEERIKLDIWYVNNLTFKLDLKIFFLTIFKILRQDGITAGENIIMSPFQGLSKKKDEEY